MPYNLLYATFRVLFQCTIRSKLYNNFMSCHGPHRLFLWHKNVITDFLIVRNNKSKCFTLLVCSNHLFYLMLKNLENLAFTSLISMFFCCYGNHNFIHMKCSAIVRFFDKNIIFPAFDNNKTKTTACLLVYSNNSCIFRLTVFAFF